MFNNIKKRAEFLAEKFDNERYLEYSSILEGFIISKVAQNKYVIDYINNKYLNKQDIYDSIDSCSEGETEESVNNDNMAENINFGSMFAFGCDNYSNITTTFGVFSYAEKNNDLDAIDSILKKAFKKQYNTIKNRETNLYKLAETENYFDSIAIYVYLTAFLGYHECYNDSDNKNLLQVSIDKIIHSLIIRKVNKNNEHNLIEEFKDILNSCKIDLRTDTSINKIIHQYYKFICDVENSKHNIAIAKKIGNRVVNNECFDLNELERSFASAEDVICELSENKDISMLVAIDYFIESLTCNSFEIATKIINKNDLLESFNLASMMCRDTKLGLDVKKDNLFIIALVLKVLCGQINNLLEQTTRACLDKSEQDRDAYMISVKHKKEIDKLNSTINEKDAQISSLNETIDNLREEIHVLKSKLNKKEYVKEKNSSDKAELQALRGLFFNLDKEPINYTETTTYFDKFDFKTVKIAFVGSESYLHAKLKDKIENCIFVEADDVNRDLNFLKNVDYLFIHTHMSHSMYYKVIEICKRARVKIAFLNSTNVDILVEQITNKIKDEV